MNTKRIPVEPVRQNKTEWSESGGRKKGLRTRRRSGTLNTKKEDEVVAKGETVDEVATEEEVTGEVATKEQAMGIGWSHVHSGRGPATAQKEGTASTCTRKESNDRVCPSFTSEPQDKTPPHTVTNIHS